MRQRRAGKRAQWLTEYVVLAQAQSLVPSSSGGQLTTTYTSSSWGIWSSGLYGHLHPHAHTQQTHMHFRNKINLKKVKGQWDGLVGTGACLQSWHELDRGTQGEGENWLPPVVLWPPCAWLPPALHTDNKIKTKAFSINKKTNVIKSGKVVN